MRTLLFELDPFSHLMKLVKLLITILSNILFGPNYVTVAVRSHAHCHNLLNKCSHLIKLAMKLVAIMSTLLYEHWSRPH